jgi:hypothetical protein
MCLIPRQTGRLTVGRNFGFDFDNELVVRQSPAGKNLRTEAEHFVGIRH